MNINKYLQAKTLKYETEPEQGTIIYRLASTFLHGLPEIEVTPFVLVLPQLIKLIKRFCIFSYMFKGYAVEKEFCIYNFAVNVKYLHNVFKCE